MRLLIATVLMITGIIAIGMLLDDVTETSSTSVEPVGQQSSDPGHDMVNTLIGRNATPYYQDPSVYTPANNNTCIGWQSCGFMPEENKDSAVSPLYNGQCPFITGCKYREK